MAALYCLGRGSSRGSTPIPSDALQALFYYFLGEVFCENPDCRFYNAHYQPELIRSQLLSGKLCERHEGMFRTLLR